MFRNLLLTLHQQFIEGHSQSERGRAYSYAPGFMFTPPPRPPVTLLFGHTRHYSKEVCADNTLPDALVCVSNLYRHQGVVVCWSETHRPTPLRAVAIGRVLTGQTLLYFPHLLKLFCTVGYFLLFEI